MPIGPLIILQLIVFAGLILFMRYILTNNVSKATSHLQGLADDYATKQREIDALLEKAQMESHDIITKAKTEADGIRSDILKKAQEEKERIIAEAKQKSEQIIVQAEKTAESIKLELQNKIEKMALDDACRLIQCALPNKFRQEIHTIWMRESLRIDFHLDSLNLPKTVNEICITSAFPLTNEEKKYIEEELKKKLGVDFNIQEKLDPNLIAGFMIEIGNIVIDGSLRYKIQEVAKELKTEA